MNKEAIYICRVSTTKQAQEGESLDTQAEICIKIARERLGVDIARGWKYAYSGAKEENKVIDEMYDYVQQNRGKIKYLVFRDIDRLTRCGSSKYSEIKEKLSSFGVQMVDSVGLIQPVANSMEHYDLLYSWSKYSPSDMTENIKADSAKEDRRNILTRLIGSEVKLARQGYQIGPANEGYINKKILVGNKKKTIQIPDPEKSEFFIKMFEMRASGQYSDTEIVNEINALGFKTNAMKKWDKGHTEVLGKRGGKPLLVKTLQRYIQRPIYCGIICRNWTYYKPVKAQFDGLVSIDVFNKANRGKVFVEDLGDNQYKILYNQKITKEKRSVKKYNSNFPYKNVILCDECGKPFMASSPRGKSGKYFPTYHCGGKKRGHSYFGIPKSDFEENLEQTIKQFKVSKLFNTGFDIVLKDVWRQKNKETIDTDKLIDNNIQELKAKQNKLVDALIDAEGSNIKKTLEGRINAIDNEIKLAESKRQKMKTTESDIERFNDYSNYLLEHLEELLLDKENLRRQEALFGLVFEKLPSYQEILARTPKLSLILETKEIPHNEKSPLVTRLGFEPRTISLKGCCSTS